MTLNTIDEKIRNIQSSELALNIHTSDYYYQDIQNFLHSNNCAVKDYQKAAQLFFSQRLYAHAASFQLQYIAKAPNHSYAHCFMGTIYMSLGLRENAIKSFKSSMKLASHIDSRYWNGIDRSSSIIIAAKSVGEVVLAIKQIDELKYFSNHIMICTRKNFVDLALSAQKFSKIICTDTPGKVALEICSKYDGVKYVQTENRYGIGCNLISHKSRGDKVLFSDPDLTSYWKNQFQSSYQTKYLIGLCWQSKKISPNHPDRSFMLEDLAILSKNDDYTLASFQYGYGSEQLHTCSFIDKFIDCQSLISSNLDFKNLLAAISNCNFFICCDTGIAQVSCALGIKTIVMVHANPSAYWTGEGTSSYMYQNAYVHKKRIEESWSDSISRLFAAKTFFDIFPE